MAYDIATISAAMDRKVLQLEQVSNNLANASTPGFKAQHLYFLENMTENEQVPENSSNPSGLVVDFAAGLIQKTDNPLDLQLQGEGFFVVQAGNSQLYTRKGDFTLNPQKQLVTQDGLPVLGESGQLTLQGSKIRVSNQGEIYVDENQVGKLKIVDFSDRSKLTKEGSGLYRDDGTAGLKKVDKPEIASGFVELSNVNVVKEMTDMIAINRLFETYAKIIQTLSEQDKLATSKIGTIT